MVFLVKKGTFLTENWDSLKGVASVTASDFIDFDSHESECLNEPSLCQHGFSLSFWLRHKCKFGVYLIYAYQ